MLNVGPAGDHLCGKLLFARLSLVVSVMVSLRASAQCFAWPCFAGLIRRSQPPTFSDTAITDRHSDTTFSSSEHTGCGYPGLLDRKNRSDMCRRWESNPRLPAWPLNTSSTTPAAPLPSTIYFCIIFVSFVRFCYGWILFVICKWAARVSYDLFCKIENSRGRYIPGRVIK